MLVGMAVIAGVILYSHSNYGKVKGLLKSQPMSGVLVLGNSTKLSW